MDDLKSKKCVPCEGGTPPLDKKQVEEYLKQLDTPWKLTHEEGSDRLRREFQFADFAKAMDFVNKVAIIAETEQHHPDIHIWYGKVLLVLWTHAAKGLTESDFIMAAKINEV